MSQYAELKKQQEALQRQREKEDAALQKKLDEAREAEAGVALQKCVDLINEFGFTAKDLGLKTAKKRKATPPMFRNAEGLEWTGKGGMRPNWVKAVLEKVGGDEEKFQAQMEKFRIK
ncbi:MAG: H-NS histone family protein [Gallionella sp.]